MSDDTLEPPSPVFTDFWSQLLVDPDITESGGEHANEGVDFARYWAIAALVDRELAGHIDYAIVFEYLQDVAVLDTPSNPTVATLYQVKKKEPGKWTRTDLCRQEQNTATDSDADNDAAAQGAPKKKKKKKKLKAGSPIGKLYLCVERLSAQIPTYGVFLSNAPMSLRLVNGDTVPLHSRTCLPELHCEDYTYIEKKIASELTLKPPLATTAMLSLEQTKVAPAAMRHTIRGIVADYLQSQLPTAANVSGQLVERLLDAFSSLSGPKPIMRNLTEIVQSKGFRRSDFTDMLNQISSVIPFQKRLDRIMECLVAEGTPSRGVTKIGEAATRMQTQLVRDPATKDSMHWEHAVTFAGQTDADGEYRSAMQHIVDKVREHIGDGNRSSLTDIDLQALAILAIMYVEQQPPAPSAQPTN
jgi:hypothetical protein